MAGNEFLNTFQNGMNQDSNVVYQPDGTYRYAKNVQLINHDGNNFTIKDSLGNRKIFELPGTWKTGFPTYVTEANRMPIGFISFADGEQQLVVFSAFDTGSGGNYGEIGLLSLTNIGESVDGKPYPASGTSPYYNGYLPLYGHDDLKFSRMYKIEGFSFAENDNIRRVYWTDYFNEPRVLDIANPIFTTYIPSGSLVAGKQYMVLNGIINYNGTEYGIGIGNVFTATGASSTYSVILTALGANVLVIEYYDVSLLNWTPDVSLGEMFFDSYGSGNCNCGNRMYFHRLKSSAAGIYTSWSYGMFPVLVGKDQSSIPYLNSQHYNVGWGSSSTLVNSTKSVKVRITNIDTKYDTIELACAEFDQTVEVPTNISIVASTPVTGSEMIIEDLGNVNLGTLTVDDLTLFSASILKCKTITTNKNYNVIANISEREEFDSFDISTISLNDYIYDMPIDNDHSQCTNVMTFAGASTPLNPSTSTNPSNVGGIQHGTRWIVSSGGTVEYPTGSGIIYNIGEVFIGNNALANYKNWAVASGAPVVRGAVSLNQYTPINNTNLRQNNIEIKSFTGWDYRNPAVACHAKGYWSDEKYRFGILFYDKKRNPFYVRWIGDHTFNSIFVKGGLLKNEGTGGVDWYSLKSNLLSISGLQIPESIYSKIDGFSIVRAIRDPTIITQGLAWQVQYEAGSPNKLHPLPSVYLGDGNGWAADPNHVYSYICPDLLLDNSNTINKTGRVGDTMKVAGWLTPLSFAGNAYKSYFSANEWATKLYDNITPLNISLNNSATLTNWLRINENDTVSNFLSGVDFNNYDMWIGVAGAGYNLDNSCGGGPSANNYALVGSKKVIFKCDIDFVNAPQTDNYSGSSGANTALPYKALVNYKITNANQYGGTGASALANTLYISTGHYQQIDSTVIADNLTVIGGNNYLVFNNLQVAGGDCFLSLIDQGYGLFDSRYGPGTPFPATQGGASMGIFFPCECTVNYDLRRGTKISDYGMHNEGSGVSWNPIRLESYAHNSGYESEGDFVQYPALPINFKNIGRFPYRMRWAGQKISGEIIDSFRTFLTNDYRDADGRYGEINNVRPKGDYVYYWQNHAVGSVPILERQLISGSAGASTVLGTGGVITRFDTITPKFGNQHQHGLTDTEQGWIWFDMRNKDVCIMSLNGGVAEITVPTGMKSFFSEAFLERLTALYNDVYLNSQTSDISSDRPLIGTGIIGVYDPKNKMSYLTFKFRSYYKEVAEPETPEQYQIISKDFTIGYSHVLNKFISFYDKVPAIWHNHNQSVLSANNPKNLNRYYASDMVLPADFKKGDVIANIEEGSEFVLTADSTFNVFPQTSLIHPFLELINKTNEIYIENEELPYAAVIEGYEYNVLYGRVVDNELELIVSPKAGQMSVTNYEMGATGDNITDITVSADNGQIAGDTNIKSTNRDYKYYDGSWWANIPLTRFGMRITDKYLRIRIKKKNWSDSPTVNDNKLTDIQFVKSTLENKR